MNLTADEFNAKFPVGTSVLYWPILPAIPGIPPHETKTRSEAWTVAGSEVMVQIGRLGVCAFLRHLEPLEPLPVPSG